MKLIGVQEISKEISIQPEKKALSSDWQKLDAVLLVVALTHQNRTEPEISIDQLLNPGILIHAEIKRTWAEIQIISDISKKV